MLQAILMGLVAGQRTMTPLAAVAVAAGRGGLSHEPRAGRLLAHRGVAATALALAAGELAGDKLARAPDRVAPAGLASRAVTGALAGAALAPRGQRRVAALAAGTTALAAAWLGWRARQSAQARIGRVASGFAEDAAVIAGAAGVLRMRPR